VNLSRQRGFTLIEIMVVVVLAGMLVAMTAVTAFPDDKARLRTEADRLAQLWMMAHDEAQVRGIPVLWEATSEGYRFVLRDGLRLVAIENDAALRARKWDTTPMQIESLDAAANTGNLLGEQRTVRLVFVRASAQDPVRVQLGYHDARVQVRGDGLGRFEVVNDSAP
jgi:general secretion pathway protein H